MRIGASYGECCRYCGSADIIIEPASSSGLCAGCSHEAAMWAARSSDTVQRYADAACAEVASAESHARHFAETARIAARRSAAARDAAQLRSGIFHWLRLAPMRARTAPQP